MQEITIIGANSYLARNLIYLMRDKNLYLYGHREKHADGFANYKHVNLFDSLSSIKAINMNVDAIFLFSGKTGTSFENHCEFIDVNEKILLNVLNEYRAQNSNARIIFPSTRLIYSDNNNALENDTGELKSVYAINKFACEQYLKLYNHVFGVNYTIFRVGLPFGSFINGASSYGTIEFMLNRARSGENIILYGDGSVRRTLTYIQDICCSMIEGAESQNCANEIFNIGGENYSLLEIAKLIATKYGVKVEFVPYPEIAAKIESGDTVFNSDKLDSIINHKAAIKFKDWLNNI